MVVHINSVAFLGIEARAVEVEVHISGGLPAFTIVGLPDKAYLLTVMPLDPTALPHGSKKSVTSWAWWDVGIRVGPRHTNYGNGSVCSFEPDHRTWTSGDSIVALFDLNAVWIARHLFLRHFGRWPGDQVLHTAHERLSEHRRGELCGCGSLQLYEHCHRDADTKTSAYDRLQEFRCRVDDPGRQVPDRAWEELARLLRQPPAGSST